MFPPEMNKRLTTVPDRLVICNCVSPIEKIP